MLELNSKQRKFLEKEAHNLSPVVIIGGAGVTEGVINMVASSIASHELIKVKFNENKEEIFALKNKAEADSTLFYHSYWADDVSIAVKKIKEKKTGETSNSTKITKYVFKSKLRENKTIKSSKRRATFKNLIRKRAVD